MWPCRWSSSSGWRRWCGAAGAWRSCTSSRWRVQLRRARLKLRRTLSARFPRSASASNPKLNYADFDRELKAAGAANILAGLTGGMVGYLSISRSLLNLRAGVDILDWNATVTVWGRNVTDERWYHGSFDAPAQTGRMNSYPAEPATYGVTFSKRWD